MPNNQFKKPVLVVGSLILLVIIIFVGLMLSGKKSDAKLDDFTKCLKNKGVIFYGAFWCPHCQDQKALFGSSQKYLPYVECSTPDAKGQLPICQEKNIAGYPTWVFADGKQQSGSLDLNTLAKESGCSLLQ